MKTFLFVLILLAELLLVSQHGECKPVKSGGEVLAPAVQGVDVQPVAEPNLMPAPTAPPIADNNAAAAPSNPIGQAPDEVIKKLSALIHAEKYDEANKLVSITLSSWTCLSSFLSMLIIKSPKSAFHTTFVSLLVAL